MMADQHYFLQKYPLHPLHSPMQALLQALVMYLQALLIRVFYSSQIHLHGEWSAK